MRICVKVFLSKMVIYQDLEEEQRFVPEVQLEMRFWMVLCPSAEPCSCH